MPAFRVEYMGDLARVESDEDGIDGWEGAVLDCARFHAADDAMISARWIGTGPGRAVAEFEVTVRDGDFVTKERAQVYHA